MIDRYRETEIRSASPVYLIVRLYEAALRHCRAAASQAGAARTRERGESVSRALAIVSELRGALDFAQGGEIARNLDALYAFASERVLDAHMRGGSGGFEEAARVLEELLPAWRQIAAAPPAPAPGPEQP